MPGVEQEYDGGDQLVVGEPSRQQVGGQVLARAGAGAGEVLADEVGELGGGAHGRVDDLGGG